MFDKKRCMENIYAIAKDKKIKIGDLEKAAGVSAGYISKLNNDDNTAVPSIEILLPIAEALGISLDFMVTANYSELGENEVYFSNFVDRLMVGTEKQKITWEIESGSYLNSNKNSKTFTHPLFISEDAVVEHPDTLKLIEYTINTYQSRFLRIADIHRFDNCYHCELNAKQKLYMMKLFIGVKNYSSEDIELDELFDTEDNTEIELYLIDYKGKVSPLCSTFSVEGEMKKHIQKLYKLVDGDKRTVNVSSSVKDAIDGFMELKW